MKITIWVAMLAAAFFADWRSRVCAGIIDFDPWPGEFRIAGEGKVAPIYVDDQDYPGVLRAANDLAIDIGRVTGTPGMVFPGTKELDSFPILIGTIGHSRIVQQLIDSKKLEGSLVQGKWESCITQVVSDPLPGVKSALVIAGSDRRGTIFGIYELSRQMGVSPWYWWVDVPTPHHDQIFVSLDRVVQGPPAVKYRGIFLNDEAPAMSGWSKEKFGGFNHQMYTHVFELLLRLKANYLWPAMWGGAFNEDDSENPRLADEYGIVMGTSHQEPMMRAQAEWDHRHRGGDWNFATDSDSLIKFWTDGIARNKNYENLTTIGMRGRNDTPMLKDATVQQSMDLLEKIVTTQRKILSEQVNPDLTKLPQLWCLYKEVQEYYERGLRVPDDVTLLWSDDNWGDIRRLPTRQERARSGGAGIYYHFDYVGDPRSYKWLNTNPLPKIWDQMNLAEQYGADRVWIVNVGDLKPMELPMDFFLHLAWNPDSISRTGIGEFTRRWAQQQFGAARADAIADVLSKYARYNGWRKPELLDPTTFSLTNYHEADRVWDAWQAVSDEAEQVNSALPVESRDAYFQLVLYPAKACATVAQLYIAAGRNQLYAKQQRASSNQQAAIVKQLFNKDRELSDHYNHGISNGKWNHMMDQSHIGYSSWNDPPHNVMPALQEIDVPTPASLGVAVEGSESAWPGTQAPAVLPEFDSVNQQSRSIDIFNRGQTPFEFSTTCDQPWVTLSQSSGEIGKDIQLWASIDWSRAPVGKSGATISISRKGGETVAVQLTAVCDTTVTRESIDGFGGLTGPISISAQAATRNVPAGDTAWKEIPDYGRGTSGMEVFPVTAASVEPVNNSPRLEYNLYIAEPGKFDVDAIVGPTMNFVPGRGLRFAISVDDQHPQILDLYEKLPQPHNQWQEGVKNNCRTLTSAHSVDSAGMHVLKIWMVDPGIVLEKLVIHRGPLPGSYFGPPGTLLPDNKLKSSDHTIGWDW